MSDWELKIWNTTSRLVPIGEFLHNTSGSLGNIFCPFHHDTRKPSAKLYDPDENGIQKLWCFSCNKHFTSYHYIKQVLRQEPYLYLIKRFGKDVIDLAIKGLVIAKRDDGESLNFVKECRGSTDNISDFIESVYTIVEENILEMEELAYV